MHDRALTVGCTLGDAYVLFERTFSLGSDFAGGAARVAPAASAALFAGPASRSAASGTSTGSGSGGPTPFMQQQFAQQQAAAGGSGGWWADHAGGSQGGRYTAFHDYGVEF
jgi:hypothetical protein